MRSIWAFVLFVKLIEGLPATSSRCEAGFEEVLGSRHCDYFAIGPQTLLDSYCSWDHQLSHGITQKFCCLGVCAFCFSDVNRSFESKFDGIKPVTSVPISDYYWEPQGALHRAFREMVAAKLGQMMEQLEGTTSFDEMFTTNTSTTTTDGDESNENTI